MYHWQICSFTYYSIAHVCGVVQIDKAVEEIENTCDHMCNLVQFKVSGQGVWFSLILVCCVPGHHYW